MSRRFCLPAVTLHAAEGANPGILQADGTLFTVEVHVAEPAPQRSLKRVWILVLVIIVAVWVIYALTGGPSTPPSQTAADSLAEPRR